MRVHTITIGDVNNPPQRLDALSTEMLHSIIAHKHELTVSEDSDDTSTLDDFIDHARIILSLRGQGAPI